METNSRSFNFLITSRGYHRYPILHKSMQCLPASLYLALSLPLFLSSSRTLSFILSVSKLTVFLLTVVSFFSHSVPFCSAFHRGGGLEQAPAPLVSSPHYWVAMETRGWRCMLRFFLVPVADSGQCWKDKWKQGGQVTIDICLCETPTLIATQGGHEQLSIKCHLVELRFISGFHLSADKK